MTPEERNSILRTYAQHNNLSEPSGISDKEAENLALLIARMYGNDIKQILEAAKLCTSCGININKFETRLVELIKLEPVYENGTGKYLRHILRYSCPYHRKGEGRVYTVGIQINDNLRVKTELTSHTSKLLPTDNPYHKAFFSFGTNFENLKKHFDKYTRRKTKKLLKGTPGFTKLEGEY